VFYRTCPKDAIICLPDDKMASADPSPTSLNHEPHDKSYLNKISNWIFICKIVILSAFNFI
jgi:hypothetical protein